jgi:hypothetical protein
MNINDLEDFRQATNKRYERYIFVLLLTIKKCFVYLEQNNRSKRSKGRINEKQTSTQTNRKEPNHG